MTRFCDEIQDALGDLNNSTLFILPSDEKISTCIDRLNKIIQKMTQHGTAKLAKLKKPLKSHLLIRYG